MVGSSAEDKVAGKSCLRQEVMTVELTCYSDTTTDGLSELTLRQNPNPKNYDIFYGSDTMLREKEFFDFHSFTKEVYVTYILIL